MVPVESSTILQLDLLLESSLYDSKSLLDRPTSVAVRTVPFVLKSGIVGTSSKNIFSPII